MILYKYLLLNIYIFFLIVRIIYKYLLLYIYID